MLFPSLYHENLFDGLDDFFSDNRQGDAFARNANRLMSTDIRESDRAYELDIELPGFRREDIKAHLENGCLTILAEKKEEKNESSGKSAQGRWVRRERWTGSCTRSFYVGDDVTEADIHAKFDNGILSVTVPKKEAVVHEKKMIAIE